MDTYNITRNSVQAYQHADLYYERTKEFRFTHQLQDYRVKYNDDTNILILERKTLTLEDQWVTIFKCGAPIAMLTYIYAL